MPRTTVNSSQLKPWAIVSWQTTTSPGSPSYPMYLSPHWDKDTQRAVVWSRLWQHHNLANPSLSGVNEQFKALCHELQTQPESSHKKLFCDNHVAEGKFFLVCFISLLCILSLQKKNTMFDSVMSLIISFFSFPLLYFLTWVTMTHPYFLITISHYDSYSWFPVIHHDSLWVMYNICLCWLLTVRGLIDQQTLYLQYYKYSWSMALQPQTWLVVSYGTESQ